MVLRRNLGVFSKSSTVWAGSLALNRLASSVEAFFFKLKNKKQQKKNQFPKIKKEKKKVNKNKK